MRAAPMVVGQICSKDSAEMPLMDNDHVVQTLAPDRPDHAFNVRILPRTLRARHHFGDPEAGNPATHRLVVDAVAVSKEPAWNGVLGKRLDQLLRGPRG